MAELATIVPTGVQKGRRKKDYRRVQTGTLTFRRKVRDIVKKQLANVEEFKWFGSGIGFTDVYSGVGYGQVNMCLIPQGLADNQRTGDELTLKSITVNVAINGPEGNNTTRQTYQDVRIMIFQFKTAVGGGVAPAVNDLLNADVFTGVRSAYSFKDVDLQPQYTMLYDKIFTVYETDPNVSNTPMSHKFVKIRVPLKYAKKKIQYQNGSTSNMNGGIWLAFIGSQPLLTTAQEAQVGAEWRVRFVDS